jgi:hypothetical protein
MRGRVLLHASKFWKPSEIEDDYDSIRHMAEEDNLAMPDPQWAEIKAAGGCIVGSVEIYDCVRASQSAFFVGKFGFLLRDPVIFEKPIPFKGELGFFDAPEIISENE